MHEGLRQILQLDERLMKKSAQAALVARETFPEAWAAQDRKQAERDEKQLLQSLERCHDVLPPRSAIVTGSDDRRSCAQLMTAICCASLKYEAHWSPDTLKMMLP